MSEHIVGVLYVKLRNLARDSWDQQGHLCLSRDHIGDKGRGDLFYL